MILDLTDNEYQYLKILLYWRLKYITNPYQEEFIKTILDKFRTEPMKKSKE